MPATRRQRAASTASTDKKEDKIPNMDYDDEGTNEVYSFEGKEYDSYQAMVDAKRKRNRDMLAKSGLIELSVTMKQETKKAAQRGITKKRIIEKKEILPRRKSNRLAGVQSDGLFVENESSGKFTIAHGEGNVGQESVVPKKPEYFNNRINDGEDLSIKEAVELADPKWVQDTSVESASKFVSQNLASMLTRTKKAAQSPTSVIPNESLLKTKLDSLSVDGEGNVAKVTPDRIYSVACHPSSDQLVVCAGDKQGYVGMWNVDESSDTDGVHLFRAHTRPVSCLSWTPSGDALMSASYDGTVRWFDVEAQSFQQIFATYDDSVVHRHHLGRNLDEGYHYWVQYVCPDHRSPAEKTMFASTSFGTAMHVDLRVGNGKITFHETLSEKKINTLR